MEFIYLQWLLENLGGPLEHEAIPDDGMTPPQPFVANTPSAACGQEGGRL